jgi:hypothetical protein
VSAISISKWVEWGINSSAVCISVSLTSVTLCTFSNREVVLPPIQNVFGNLQAYHCSHPSLCYFEVLIYSSMQVSSVLVLLFVASSSILSFKYCLFLFLKCLKCLPGSRHTLFRLSPFISRGTCNQWSLAYFLWSDNFDYHLSNHGLCFFSL